MIQQQIESFSRSLKHLATQYSDPSIVLQHIPVLKNNLMFQQNPEYILYGLGGLIFSFFALKRWKKNRAARTKNIGLVMPQPYLGDADHAQTHETSPASFDTETADEDALETSVIPETVSQVRVQTAARTPAEQLEDVSAITFSARSALTPDEARLRVVAQASVNEFGAGYMIMARTSLAALLMPGHEAVGPERAQALSAIQDKYVDFGIFDRTGRCLVALEVASNDPVIGNKSLEKAVVKQALGQAGIPMIAIAIGDTPTLLQTKLAPYLKATARVQTSTISVNPTREEPKRAPHSGRPVRPVRPVRAAIAAK